jgi:hypothetical protein
MCQHVSQLFVVTQKHTIAWPLCPLFLLCVTACVEVGMFKLWWVMKSFIIQPLVVIDSGWHLRVGRVGPVQLNMSTY